MTPDTMTGTVDLVELLRKKENHLPKTIVSYLRGLFPIPEESKRPKDVLLQIMKQVLLAEDEAVKEAYAIQTIILMETLRIIDKDKKIEEISKIYMNPETPEDVLERVPEELGKIRPYFDRLIGSF